MDGNGRWANLRGLPRHLGHKEACNRIIEIFDLCQEFDIDVFSLYAFSTENWKRPQDEIDHLFDYLEIFFKKEIDYLDSHGGKVVISGDLSRLPEKTSKIVLDAINRTKNNTKTVMNICLNYGGKEELTRAAKSIAKEVRDGKLSIDEITEQVFEDHLYTSGLPNVDLLIRTSGEQRTSNFLPWQLAYAEFVFTDVKWPDFKRDAFLDCLEQFNKRNRRFGGLNNGENTAK